MGRLAFDMSDGPKGAKRPLERPLDGGVGSPAVEQPASDCTTQRRGLALVNSLQDLGLMRGALCIRLGLASKGNLREQSVRQ